MGHGVVQPFHAVHPDRNQFVTRFPEDDGAEGAARSLDYVLPGQGDSQTHLFLIGPAGRNIFQKVIHPSRESHLNFHWTKGCDLFHSGDYKPAPTKNYRQIRQGLSAG
jgi:hypothetical protein